MSNNHLRRTMRGLATASGLAVGPVFVYRRGGAAPIPEYLTESGREQNEVQRLQRALTVTRRDLDGLIASVRDHLGQDDLGIFESHQMLLEDPLLLAEAKRLILEKHLNAEAAVRQTASHARQQFERMKEPYFRERVRDIDDVERRLIAAFAGGGIGAVHPKPEIPSIIVADDLTPSETVQLPRAFVLGFATNGGSTTSHVALLARAMGIPAVTGLGDITSQVVAGETLLLDGTTGEVVLDADEQEVREFTDRADRQNSDVVMCFHDKPAGTLKDGSQVLLYANVQPGLSVQDVKSFGARGVGLYRSEYLWLCKAGEPTEDEQFEAYREAALFAATLGPKAPITIRTLDVGGDKLVRSISAPEANPFLGNRSIRYQLSHQEMFRAQLRAILRASAFGRVSVLYPMISCLEELREATRILEETKRQLDGKGVAYDKEIPVGAMIEVPSAAVSADALAKHVDFFSIGTNDLVQYTMAADRGNEAVHHLYQPTNSSVLQLVRMTIAAAKRHKIGVAVCGESAADPVTGLLWVAMGVDELSMSASYIPQMSRLLLHLTREDLNEYAAAVEAVGAEATARDILDFCRTWLMKRIPGFDGNAI